MSIKYGELDANCASPAALCKAGTTQEAAHMRCAVASASLLSTHDGTRVGMCYGADLRCDTLRIFPGCAFNAIHSCCVLFWQRCVYVYECKYIRI